MQTFETESSLLDPVRGTLRRRGFRQQRPEVRFFDYSMDIYGYAASQGMSIAVELKLRRWMRAFEQALIYQLCADYVYMALPHAGARLVDLSLLAEHGIGLICVKPGPRCAIVLPAAPSKVIDSEYRKFYIDLLKENQSWRQ
jgi:hypothetical protein